MSEIWRLLVELKTYKITCVQIAANKIGSILDRVFKKEKYMYIKNRDLYVVWYSMFITRVTQNKKRKIFDRFYPISIRPYPISIWFDYQNGFVKYLTKCISVRITHYSLKIVKYSHVSKFLSLFPFINSQNSLHNANNNYITYNLF